MSSLVYFVSFFVPYVSRQSLSLSVVSVFDHLSIGSPVVPSYSVREKASLPSAIIHPSAGGDSSERSSIEGKLLVREQFCTPVDSSRNAGNCHDPIWKS